MFASSIYQQRRQLLKKDVQSGIILLLGNDESPMNYSANAYHFRQDSTFLYFFGIDRPGFSGIIDIDRDEDTVFANDFAIDDIIWTGPQPLVRELAKTAGCANSGDLGQLEVKIRDAINQKRKIHYLPPYRAENKLKLEQFLGIKVSGLSQYASTVLIEGVIKQRSIKSEVEIDEIEKAFAITHEIYSWARQFIKPGIYEYQMVAKIEEIARSRDVRMSFPIIATLNGQVFHNLFQGNKMKDGDLFLLDCGAESPEHYASDITRAYPVSGKFTPKQKGIYEIVLKAQLTAIGEIKPGVKNKEIHLKAAKVIAEGLKEIGLIKGNIDTVVHEGIHALFFPHGLGHMIGLDAHDMEDLGENYVGYDKNIHRSDQFGLAYLRMAKEHKPGYVVTVEPGIYFIPQLIDKWRAEKKGLEFINFDKVEDYKNFTGIRIEDNVLITKTGNRVLGKSIPKSVDELENQ